MACEKQQVAVLADRLDSLITEVARRFGAEIGPVAATEPEQILSTPVDAEFRVSP